jgi:hypothetical protein
MDLKEADNIDLDGEKEKERRDRGESIKRETKRNGGGGALVSTHRSTAELSVIGGRAGDGHEALCPN